MVQTLQEPETTMDTTTTADPAGKRARNGSVILTDRLCTKRVTERIKFYDRKCPGLYVSIIPAGSPSLRPHGTLMEG